MEFQMRNKTFISSMVGIAAAAAVAGSANAEIIYDSSSMYQWGTVSPTATSGWNGNIVSHPTQAYQAQQVAEVGGKIGFAGTARFAQSATVQMRTGPNGSPAIAGNVTLTLNFYSINVDGSIGSTLGSRTQTFASPAGSGSTNTTYRPYYDATFDLSSLSLTLPNQVYFGVALLTPGLDATTQSTNISLWNYGTAAGFGPTDSDYDGPSIKAGTDLSNSVWLRAMNGTVSSPSYSGFTPNLTVNAVPAPGAIALLGIAGVASRRRRD
jgi:hypothetical protein